MFLTSTLIMKPGGFTGTAGTPNYLQSLDDYVTQVVWTDTQVGGLSQATLRCRIQYENVMDIQAGNWVVFGLFGGTTSALSSGATSLTVPNCTDDLGNQHIISGDSILVTDGVNAEIFKATTVTYSGTTATITLGAAASQSTTSLLNAYPSGANVTVLKWQGLLSARKRTTALSDTFDITVTGMMWRYTKVLADFDIESQDSGVALYQICSGFSVMVPEIIVNSANFVATSGINYTGTASHTAASTVINNILTTEMGGSTPNTPSEASYWALWVDELRQINHQRVKTQMFASPTYTLDLTNSPLSPPALDPSTVSVSGGSLPSRTYYVRWTYLTLGGETVGSTEATIPVPANRLFQTSSPAAFGPALYYNVYISTTSGAEVRQNTSPIAIGTSWTEPSTGLISGTPAPPSVSTATTNIYGDVLGPLQPQDMDMSRLLNVVLAIGGLDTSGNVLDGVYVCNDSFADFGYYVGVLSNPNITDKFTLGNWVTGQLGVQGWPMQTGKLDFTICACRMNARDLLEITGFTGFGADGSTLITNPVSIQYTCTMANSSVTASAQLTQQQPNLASIGKEIANETSIRQRETSNATNVQTGYIVSGCVLSTSGLHWSTTAGSVYYNGTTYAIPAQGPIAMTANDTIKLGVQVAGTAPAGYTLPCVCPMPSFYPGAGFQRLSAQNVYSVEYVSGSYLSIVPQTDFQGLYLGTLSAGASSITVTQRLTPYGGIGFKNLIGDTSGNGSTPLVNGNTLNLLHSVMSAGVQDALNSSGGFLNVQFPGAQQNASGALTDVDGITSSTTILTPSGTTLLIEGVITAPNATGNNTRGFFWGGNLSLNYYKLLWNTSGLTLTRISGGSGTILYNSATNTPAYDANPHSVQIACIYNGSTSNTIEVSIDGIYSFTFVDTSPPAVPSSINIQPYTGGSAGTLSNFFVSASGTTYLSAPKSYKQNYDNGGNLLKSSSLNTNVPNIAAWTTSLVLHWSSSGTSPNITMSFWYDNGFAGTDATIYNADGSTIDIGHYTSAAPVTTVSSLTSGETLSVLIYWQVGHGMTVDITAGIITPAAIQAAYADGGYIAINATMAVSTNITAGGSGNKQGGGAGHGGGPSQL